MVKILRFYCRGLGTGPIPDEGTKLLRAMWHSHEINQDGGTHGHMGLGECTLSCVRLFVSPWTGAHEVPLSVGLPRPEYWMGCHFLLQKIFLTEGSNPSLSHLLHWQADSLPLRYLGSWFTPKGPSTVPDTQQVLSREESGRILSQATGPPGSTLQPLMEHGGGGLILLVELGGALNLEGFTGVLQLRTNTTEHL